MPSPTGWREVPCIECGEFVPGINFGERCPACLERRQGRAWRLASRAALGATIVVAAWVMWRMPVNNLARWYAGLAIAATYFLVRLIVRRVAMEVLK